MTNKRRAFIEYYLQCWNATEAARLAKFKHPHSQGPRLLENVEIKDEIARRLGELKIDADKVLSLLMRQATGSIEDFIDIIPGGRQAIINLEKAQELQRLSLVKKIKVTKGGIEIELYDAQNAIRQIRDMLGLDADKDDPGSEEKPFVIKVLKGVSTDDL